MGAYIVTSWRPLAANWRPHSVSRILCLGNELLADDSLGSIVARQVREWAPEEVDVVSTSETGLRLLDFVLETDYLLVIDTVTSGTDPPGTISVFREEDLSTVAGGSPHYIGLREVLTLGRRLGLPVPKVVVLVVVKAEDCTTVGGALHPAVRAALPALINLCARPQPALEDLVKSLNVGLEVAARSRRALRREAVQDVSEDGLPRRGER